MNFTKMCEQEKKALNYFKLLPHSFKKIGFIGFIFFALAAFFLRVVMNDTTILYSISAKLTLVFMLIISISKEKIEDEMISKLRVQSYSFAFVMGVGYALLMPFIDFLVDSAREMQVSDYSEMSSGLLLWFMLVIQIAYFQALKRSQS